ncbi:hypothetical protein PIIN_11168 [Serendipita indica DSM 11827]|uniref:Uncharacterized protein n=1 Tax=Serendipita indica (strain DSM 11827) TaxID=1109443 RepID=G4U0U3_SERID|nr:hypothetical protein PIIN_11168 [Serendipita indica DSM 11827]
MRAMAKLRQEQRRSGPTAPGSKTKSSRGISSVQNPERASSVDPDDNKEPQAAWNGGEQQAAACNSSE